MIAGDDTLARLAEAEAQRYGVAATPSFLVGATGGQLHALQVAELTPAAFTSHLDALVEAVP